MSATSSQNREETMMTTDLTPLDDIMHPISVLLEFNASDNNSKSFRPKLSRQSTQGPQFIEVFLPGAEDLLDNNDNDDIYRSAAVDKKNDLTLGKSILKNSKTTAKDFQSSNMNDARKSIYEASIRIAKAPLIEDENRFSTLKDVDKVGKWTIARTKEEENIRRSRNRFVQSLKYSLLKPFSKVDSDEVESDHSTGIYSSLYKPRPEDNFTKIGSDTHSTVKEGVHFSFVEVREYLYTIGLTPGCSRGVPLTIEWDSFSLTKVAFDEYEQRREPQRRELKELRIPKDVRAELLLDLGHSMKEIRDTIKMNNTLRIQQLQTKQFLYKMPKEEKLERIRRRISSLFTNRKKKEREFMKLAYSFSH